MLTNPSHIKTLFEKYSNREATPDEIRELFQLSLEGSADAELIKLLEDKIAHTEIDDYYDKEVWDLVFVKIKDDIAAIEEEVQPKRTKLWPRYLGIAAAVIGMAIGIYFFTAPRHPELVSGSQYANDIAPGKNTATLSSSNGSTINLSEAKTGVAIDARALTYNDGTKIDPSSLGMTDGDSRSLEVITPKGGTYSIILQDGTKVWLNADSKLEFLSNYRNKLQRIVKLTGEAYFEVAKVFSPGKAGRGPERVPFIVESNGQRVDVLGTHFNVSAYKGEAIRTTLLEGSVRIEGKLMLKPGQQSEISLDKRVSVKQVDPTEAIAWKNGKFRFDNTSLEEVMKQLARWYDVEVIYPDGIPDERFTGGINRNSKASEALRVLQLMKVKFKIEGKQIIVEK